MGSIALPALDIKPPVQQADPMQQMGQLMALKGQMQNQPLQNQMMQNQVQSSGMQVQQQQQQLKDQQAMTSAMKSWDGKDYNDILPLVLKNGGSATAVMGLKKNILDQQTQIATQAKDLGQGASAQATATKLRSDQVAGALAPFADPQQIPDAQLAPTLLSKVNDLVQSGSLTPQAAQKAQQLAQSGDPTAIRSGVDLFRKTLMAQSQITDEALKTAQTEKANADAQATKSKVDPTSPLYSPSPMAVALGTAPGAGVIQTNEVRQAARKAGAEESARMPGELALARQRQALTQGDPNAAGQLLVSGDATLSELKARGSTPEFIAQTLNAAHQISGGRYNAQQADAAFQVAKSPAQVAFFGSAKSLIDKGGTLDQLSNAAKDIPGGLIPAFNSIADWEKASTGSGPIAKYASLALGVADDYSKVMGGGQGSDSSRLSALKLVGANQSPAQRSGSISGIRGAVGSQMNSRIGNNPILGRMYGDPATGSAAPSATSSSDPFSQFGGKAH